MGVERNTMSNPSASSADSRIDMASVVNLARYPLDNLDSDAGKAFTKRCRDEIERTGACLFPDFITEATLNSWLTTARQSESGAHQVEHNFSYGAAGEGTEFDPATLPADDPRGYRSHTAMKFIAKDRIVGDSSIKALHDWKPMAEFVQSVMGQPAHPSACPLSGLVFTIAYETEEQDWHFDANDYIVTLMLQRPSGGGHFEYIPGLRTPDGEDDYETINTVHNGTCPDVIRPPIRPGTLTLFKGRYNYHRASPVTGEQPRVMAIFAFEREPEKKLTDPDSSRIFFGRPPA